MSEPKQYAAVDGSDGGRDGAAKKRKLELIASVLGEAIAAHDEMIDEVGYSPLDKRRLDEAALAVVELHASEVWS